MTKVKNYFEKHQKALIWIGAILLFVIIFIISIAGSLRVFLPYVSDLTGFPFGHKRYLIVFQNNSELRPTGGFISSYGIINFTAGIPSIKIDNVYGDVDNHPRLIGPYPMGQLLANKWYKGYSFRDGNFNPDFPSSAEELIRLYDLAKPGTDFDGVISINFNALQDILKAIGPVKVNGEWLGKDNVFEKVTDAVNDIDRHNLAALANRKSILKPLATQLIWKIILNPFKLRKISDTITASLSKKDIQLYFRKSDGLKNLVAKFHWNGAWPHKVKSDFLAVNEANLGGMKSDRYITRYITYHLIFTEAALEGLEKPKAEVTVEMHHFGIENVPLSGHYSGYLRFFDTPNPNKFVADQIVKLNPGEKTTITKDYDISLKVLKNAHYSLYLLKQSGTHDIYSVVIEFPRGYGIASNDFEVRENEAFYEAPLTQDIKLNLTLLPDTNPPFPVLQENKVLNRIDLHFNEDMNQDYLSDPFSYQVTDANITDPDHTDHIKIVNVKTTAKDVELYLSGETVQPEERYLVRLRNLRDIHGNILSDRQITVVQRLQ